MNYAIPWTQPLHVMAFFMFATEVAKTAKVVQTTLEEEEYRTLRELLKRKRLSLKEGLHLAVTRLLQEEIKLDRSDPFLTRKPFGRSGLRNLSNVHDRYLYGKKRV